MGVISNIRKVSKLEDLTSADYLDDIDFALYNGLSVIFCKNPNSPSIQLAIGERVREISYDDIDQVKDAFFIQPFDTSKPLRAITVNKKTELTVADIKAVKINSVPFHVDHEDVTELSRDAYQEYARNAITELEQGKFKKLVCARAEKFNKKIDPLQVFVDLCEAYPNAFVSLVSTKEFGTWVGATPEILMEDDGKKIHVVALAGTQVVKDEFTTKTALWSTKEIEEQALVSRYIINRFKTIRLREFEDVGPRTIQAGNLFHLCTDFYIDKKETEIDQLECKIPKLLHPTSAVCGMPQEQAEAFIKEREGASRSLYSGFIGYKNMDEIKLYVNLRCMRVQTNSCILYAGAGITKDSDPEKEWEETGHKMATIKNLIQS